jgi:hypothetical protein
VPGTKKRFSGRSITSTRSRSPAQVDWAEARAQTAHTPYAAPFFTLVERLGIVSHMAEPQTTKPRIRVA